MDIATVLPSRAARLMYQLPRESRLYATLKPATQWGWSEVLANRSNYLLEMLVWLQTKDATKKGAKKNKPKPYVPDFMKPDKKEGVAKDAEGHTVDDIKSILSLPRG